MTVDIYSKFQNLNHNRLLITAFYSLFINTILLFLKPVRPTHLFNFNTLYSVFFSFLVVFSYLFILLQFDSCVYSLLPVICCRPARHSRLSSSVYYFYAYCIMINTLWRGVRSLPTIRPDFLDFIRTSLE